MRSFVVVAFVLLRILSLFSSNRKRLNIHRTFYKIVLHLLGPDPRRFADTAETHCHPCDIVLKPCLGCQRNLTNIRRLPFKTVIRRNQYTKCMYLIVK